MVTALKECRKEQADIAFVCNNEVFTDQELDRIAQAKPTTLGQLRALPGIPEMKARTYGAFGCLNPRGVFDDAVPESTWCV